MRTLAWRSTHTAVVELLSVQTRGAIHAALAPHPWDESRSAKSSSKDERTYSSDGWSTYTSRADLGDETAKVYLAAMSRLGGRSLIMSCGTKGSGRTLAIVSTQISAAVNPVQVNPAGQPPAHCDEITSENVAQRTSFESCGKIAREYVQDLEDRTSHRCTSALARTHSPNSRNSQTRTPTE